MAVLAGMPYSEMNPNMLKTRLTMIDGAIYVKSRLILISVHVGHIRYAMLIVVHSAVSLFRRLNIADHLFFTKNYSKYAHLSQISSCKKPAMSKVSNEPNRKK